jgi:hypothetical protein
MYTVALLILVGMVASFVSDLAFEKLPFVKRIPLLGEPSLFFVAVTILTVWLLDVSILGAFGAGATAQWIDIVGSGIAVAASTRVVDTALGYLEK